MRSRLHIGLMWATLACGGAPDDSPVDSGAPDAGPTYDRTMFATSVVSFGPGEGAGFGQDKFPDVVLGPPSGKGANAGSLDVLSLGNNGSIVLTFDRDIVDGPGPDLIVFENPFVTPDGAMHFFEAGIVSASADGIDFTSWPCAADDESGGFQGCAGTTPTLASIANGLDATDPKTAGGNAFDLQAIGLTRARFVRITDGGHNPAMAPSGGFDLDAVSIVHASDP